MNAPRLVVWAGVVLSALGACSKDNANQNQCATSGTYVFSVTINGPYVTNPAFPEYPLIDSANGACDLAQPSTACDPAELTVTVTFEGVQSTNDSLSQLQPIRWTASDGESGTCSDVSDQTSGSLFATSDAGGPDSFTTCSWSANSCTGGSIDSLGMTFDLSGQYNHAIAAGVSQDGCCWRGTAEKP